MFCRICCTTNNILHSETVEFVYDIEYIRYVYVRTVDSAVQKNLLNEK